MRKLTTGPVDVILFCLFKFLIYEIFQACDSTCASCNGPNATNCTSCASPNYLTSSSTCETTCLINEYARTSDRTCQRKIYLNFLFSNQSKLADPKCATSAVLSNIQRACHSCNSGYVLYNFSCISSCPDGYIAANGECSRCSSDLYYFNHTCISSCPLTTYLNVKDCLPCYIGCEICKSHYKYDCSACSEGFYLMDNSCHRGCPPDMYENPETKTCQQCQDPCFTCGQPNNQSCTSCLKNYYLLDGSCVTKCPVTHYQSFIRDSSNTVKVPACFLKFNLNFGLSLTLDSHVIKMKFNYGIVYLILAITTRINYEINNVQIDPELFTLSPYTESIIKIQLPGDQYYPPDSVFKVTIDLESDFNTDIFQEFLLVNKTQSIELKEIYPFSATEKNFISGSSGITSFGGTVNAVIQVFNAVASGGGSMNFLRIQSVGEIIQLLRFIDIRWAPNIVAYFEDSYLDPTSMALPIDIVVKWNEEMVNRNYSMPQIFESYEVSPFFSANYSGEISNLFVWLMIVIFTPIIVKYVREYLDQKKSKLSTAAKKEEGKSPRKLKQAYANVVHKTSRVVNKYDGTYLSNFILMFVLSIYLSGFLWSLVNIKYDSTLLEPESTETKGSLAAAVFCFIIMLGMTIKVFKLVLSNRKYILEMEEEDRPPHLKKFKCLFEDYNKNKLWQIMFIPISLIRCLIVSWVIALLCPYGTAQIVIFWVTDLAFIIYYIKFKPLQVRWLRIITLVIEVLTFGCISIGLLLDIIDRNTDPDPSALVGLGTVFLILTLAISFCALYISFVGIVELIKTGYQLFMKCIKRKSDKVHPIALSRGEVESPTYFSSARNLMSFQQNSSSLKPDDKKQSFGADNQIDIFNVDAENSPISLNPNRKSIK